MDSTAIISILETYFLDTSYTLPNVIKYFPAHTLVKDGKESIEFANRYFVMSDAPVTNAKIQDEEK